MNPIVIERIGKIEDYKVHWYSADANPVNDPSLVTRGRGGNSKPLTDEQKAKLKKYDDNIVYYKNKALEYQTQANSANQMTPFRNESADDFRKRRTSTVQRLRNLADEQMELMLKEEVKKFNYMKEIGLIASNIQYEGQTVEDYREARNAPTVLLSSTLTSTSDTNTPTNNTQPANKLIKIGLSILIVGIVIYVGYKIIK